MDDFTKATLTAQKHRGFPDRSYLLSGPKGIGKKALAFEIAKTFNCNCTESKCASCLKIELQQTPDFTYVEGTKVEDLTVLSEVTVPVDLKFRFIALDLTEAHHSIFSKILRFMEEPPENTSMILMTKDLQIPFPIVSRSTILDMPILSREKFNSLFGGDSWEICGGIPGNFERVTELEDCLGRICSFIDVKGLLSPKEFMEFCSFMEEDIDQKLRLWVLALKRKGVVNRDILMVLNKALNNKQAGAKLVSDFLVWESRMPLVHS